MMMPLLHRFTGWQVRWAAMNGEGKSGRRRDAIRAVVFHRSLVGLEQRESN